MCHDTRATEAFSRTFHNPSMCHTDSYRIAVTTSSPDAEKEQWEGVEQADGCSCGGGSIYV